MTKKNLLAIVAGIVTLLLLTSMLSGCGKTPAEMFEEGKTSINTNGAEILKVNASFLLKENGISIDDSYFRVGFIDGIPYITFTILTNGRSELRSYSVETEYDGPIASAWSYNSDVINVYGEMLNIDDYFRSATYSLQDDKIVVSKN